MLKHVNENNFENEVLKNEKPILVDFYAEWCGPCKMVAPILENMGQNETKFDIAKLNIDENNQLAMQYKVMSVPTMILFKNGKPVDGMIGFADELTIKNIVNKHLD
jgi:thioredoxin 1